MRIVYHCSDWQYNILHNEPVCCICNDEQLLAEGNEFNERMTTAALPALDVQSGQ